MQRDRAISAVERHFDGGGFVADPARRVALPTESQNPEPAPVLARYLRGEMLPSFARAGFSCRVFDNPLPAKGGPFLLAEQIEDAALPTVLSYGHGDVIRGQDASWRHGIGPWELKQQGDRLYGRGTADNKGQHTINLAAVEAVLATCGKLGFNLRVLIETCEEVGSPGLRECCERLSAALAADVFIASDGPCLRPDQPTIFLAHALATITGPKGEIRVPALHRAP